MSEPYAMLWVWPLLSVSSIWWRVDLKLKGVPARVLKGFKTKQAALAFAERWGKRLGVPVEIQTRTVTEQKGNQKGDE